MRKPREREREDVKQESLILQKKIKGFSSPSFWSAIKIGMIRFAMAESKESGERKRCHTLFMDEL